VSRPDNYLELSGLSEILFLEICLLASRVLVAMDFCGKNKLDFALREV
jgi:hypothetical protein